MATCSSCEAPIIWMMTAPRGGKPARPIPVNAHGTGETFGPRTYVDGNLALTGNKVNTGRGVVDEVKVVGSRAGSYIAHFATCPRRDDHRRTRPSTKGWTVR